MGDSVKSDELTEHICKKFPNYLFAKLAKAEICLRKGETHRIPEIFDYKYDLTQVCPGRDVFHKTEAMGFAGVMGRYFARIGKLDIAEVYLQMLRKVDPEHQATHAVMTTILVERARLGFEKMLGRSKKRLK